MGVSGILLLAAMMVGDGVACWMGVSGGHDGYGRDGRSVTS